MGRGRRGTACLPVRVRGFLRRVSDGSWQSGTHRWIFRCFPVSVRYVRFSCVSEAASGPARGTKPKPQRMSSCSLEDAVLHSISGSSQLLQLQHGLNSWLITRAGLMTTRMMEPKVLL